MRPVRPASSSRRRAPIVPADAPLDRLDAGNYHYLVPELAPDQRFSYASKRVVDELAEARVRGGA